VPFVREGRERDDPCARRAADNPPGRFDAVDMRFLDTLEKSGLLKELYP